MSHFIYWVQCHHTWVCMYKFIMKLCKVMILSESLNVSLFDHLLSIICLSVNFWHFFMCFCESLGQLQPYKVALCKMNSSLFKWKNHLLKSSTRGDNCEIGNFKKYNILSIFKNKGATAVPVSTNPGLKHHQMYMSTWIYELNIMIACPMQYILWYSCMNRWLNISTFEVLGICTRLSV